MWLLKVESESKLRLCYTFFFFLTEDILLYFCQDLAFSKSGIWLWGASEDMFSLAVAAVCFCRFYINVWCKGTLQEVIITVIAKCPLLYFSWLARTVLFLQCDAFQERLCQFLPYEHRRFILGKCFITNVGGNIKPLLFQKASKQSAVDWKEVQALPFEKMPYFPLFCKESKLSFLVLENNIIYWNIFFLLPS